MKVNTILKNWEMFTKRNRRIMDEEKIDRLYMILERAEKEQDYETELALRWAIFKIEGSEKTQWKI